MLRPRITDARGRRRTLLPPVGDSARRRMRIERRVDVTGLWSGSQLTLATVILLPLLVILGLVIPAVLHLGWLPRWSVFVLAIPIGAAPPLILMALTRSLFARSYAGAYVRAGLCPSCGYDLSATEAEGDGCRVCPECGGAWRAG